MVFDKFFNNSDSDIGNLSSENESEDNILVSNRFGTCDFDNLFPTPTQRGAGKNKTACPPNATKRPNVPHQPLANKMKNGNSVDRGF